nr:PAS domain-containing protein [Paracoccus sp. NBH48]
MIWSTRPDGFHDYYNHRWYEFTGVPEGSTDGEAWAGMFHPDDQDRTWARWRQSLETGQPYEIEYRLRHRSGEYRWVLVAPSLSATRRAGSPAGTAAARTSTASRWSRNSFS